MRSLTGLSVLLLAAPAAAQPRVEAPASQGAGYSLVGQRPRVAVAPAPTAAPAAANTGATVSVVTVPTAGATAAPSTGAAPSGPRGPSPDGPTVTITNTQGGARGAAPNTARAGDVSYTVAPDGTVVVVQRGAAGNTADAGVAESNIPTTGALYGGPLPGPSIAYMGIPVDTRRPWVAPPLAPGAVLPGHALPASTAAPPPGATPWVPYSTSGFQLGPGGTSTETSGYGFTMPSGTNENPGTLRNPGR